VRSALILAGVLAVLGLILARNFRRWSRLTERERFLLGMKQISRPGNMTAKERERLKLLRSPWWAVWRWIPGLWRHRPGGNPGEGKHGDRES
jgi:hypothetical protein